MTKFDRHYRRVSERTWLREARSWGWGLEDVPAAIRRWRAKHPTAPSPFLLCVACGDPVLAPALRRQSAELRNLFDGSPAWAQMPCYECGGGRTS
jgi:hypothetical protein